MHGGFTLTIELCLRFIELHLCFNQLAVHLRKAGFIDKLDLVLQKEVFFIRL